MTRAMRISLALLALLPMALSVPVNPEGGKHAKSSMPKLTEAAAADLITDLPGLPEGVTFRMFSGLVRVDGRRSLFYWYVESMRSPKDDPLVLWTNGGPGCSGLGGFFTEQGPFRPNKRGTLDFNPYTWNKIANMIFIEQPAGVGFSIAEGNVTYTDEAAAIDNYRFILGFLDRYPERKENSFYITSESYGGHYLPTLAMQLVDNGGVNFKGLAVGNPLTWMPYRDYGQYATYANHQLIPKPLWDSYLRTGCAMVEEGEQVGSPAELQARKDSCSAITDQMDRLTEDMDPYALDFPVCTHSSLAAGRTERHALLRKIRQSRRRPAAPDAPAAPGAAAEAAAGAAGRLGGYFPTKYAPCADNYVSAYLNRADVQAAIHAGAGGGAAAAARAWADCNDTINEVYSPDDVAAPMMPVYRALLSAGGLRVLVYSGDDDAVCATAGAQLWIWALGPAVAEPWHPWYTRGQVSGFTVGFDGGFRFATVHGAGHMVPSTRPAQALDLLDRFLSGAWDGPSGPAAAAAEEGEAAAEAAAAASAAAA